MVLRMIGNQALPGRLPDRNLRRFRMRRDHGLRPFSNLIHY